MKIADVMDYRLKDDDTTTGGITFMNEKVRDFLWATNLSEEDEVSELNQCLVASGILPIPEFLLK